MAALIDPLVDSIYSLYKAQGEAEEFRPHLGASVIGVDCDRYSWLHFRWVYQPEIEGRIYRLFETGKREEKRLLRNLRSVGAEIISKQLEVKAFGGHFGGSADGTAKNLPGQKPESEFILEFKTASRFAYKPIMDKGCKDAKPEHYAQIQAYMLLSGIHQSIYIVSCKDTDDVYCEKLYLDRDYAVEILKKAERIVFATAPADKLKRSSDPCKYCSFREACHGETKAMPEMNCRTCIHSTPTRTGEWRCEKKDIILSIEEQRKGCTEHLFIPNVVPYDVVGEVEGGVEYLDNGKRVINTKGGLFSVLS